MIGANSQTDHADLFSQHRVDAAIQVLFQRAIDRRILACHVGQLMRKWLRPGQNNLAIRIRSHQHEIGPDSRELLKESFLQASKAVWLLLLFFSLVGLA